MADTSARLALPLLAVGQSQKEMFHNEALQRLDLACQAAVEAVAMDDPPASPALGQCWIVGPSPTGDWAGQAGALAGWTAGGWRFLAPAPGSAAWSRADGAWAVFGAGGWEIGQLRGARLVLGGEQVVGPRGAAIANPAGGGTVDAEARETLAAILSAIRDHGLIAT